MLHVRAVRLNQPNKLVLNCRNPACLLRRDGLEPVARLAAFKDCQQPLLDVAQAFLSVTGGFGTRRLSDDLPSQRTKTTTLVNERDALARPQHRHQGGHDAILFGLLRTRYLKGFARCMGTYRDSEDLECASSDISLMFHALLGLFCLFCCAFLTPGA